MSISEYSRLTLADFSQDDFDRLAVKAVRAVGSDRILAMSRAQVRHLNETLGEILIRRGSVDRVTDPELVGAFELIVDHVLPDYLEAAFAQFEAST